ncbi:uncharacterized protein G2W53_039323 [Senna tora]|uniref:Uncharacterized protein n=1 Tax=Senna tora TaxID=362788 RepID=A0A834SNG8_9FABA|nr:uncharacterized protein G2W53_039323 [Senna tora]
MEDLIGYFQLPDAAFLIFGPLKLLICSKPKKVDF